MKLPTRYPPPSHPQSTSKPNENSPLSTLSTYSNDIEKEGGKREYIGPQGTIGKRADRVDRWIGSTTDAPAQNTVKRPQAVALTEPDGRGVPHRVGDDHPLTKLSDEQVEQIRDEYEDGVEGRGPRIGYRALAKKYGTNKRTVRDIVNYKRRNAWAARWAVPRRNR